HRRPSSARRFPSSKLGLEGVERGSHLPVGGELTGIGTGDGLVDLLGVPAFHIELMIHRFVDDKGTVTIHRGSQVVDRLQLVILHAEGHGPSNHLSCMILYYYIIYYHHTSCNILRGWLWDDICNPRFDARVTVHGPASAIG